MEYTINGARVSFDQEKTLVEIMNHLGIQEQVMAIAVNMEVVKKDKWEQFTPKAGDAIEMLHFVGGG